MVDKTATSKDNEFCENITCTKCNVKKPQTEFAISKYTNTGYLSYCKSCKSLANRKLDEKNPEKRKESGRKYRLKRKNLENDPEKGFILINYRRNISLQHKYGITLDTYNQILENQGNKCAICQDENAIKKETPHLDHCHSTGKVRGVLCRACNVALGLFRDNEQTLSSAINYLSKHRSK